MKVWSYHLSKLQEVVLAQNSCSFLTLTQNKAHPATQIHTNTFPKNKRIRPCISLGSFCYCLITLHSKKTITSDECRNYDLARSIHYLMGGERALSDLYMP